MYYDGLPAGALDRLFAVYTQLMCIRKQPWATKETMNLGRGVEKFKMDYPTSCYTLGKEELQRFCDCIHGIEVSSGYSTNIVRLLDIKTRRLIGMKSNDYHVMIMQIIPVAIRGIMKP